MLGQLLDGSLAAATDVRAQSEVRLTELLRTRGFALQLSEFLFSIEATEPQRQLSALLLKKLITSYWAPTDDHTYVVAEEEKLQVKHTLVLALQPQVLALFTGRKLQTALCLLLTAIFERDWPDQWPEIMPMILSMIAHQHTLQMDVAVRFLSLSDGHFSSDNCLELVTSVFPHLYRAFQSPTDLSSATKCRIARIVQSLLLMVSMEANVENLKARHVLQEYTTQWFALFFNQLAHPVNNYAMKIQVLTIFTSFVREWPVEMTEVLPQLLSHVQNLLLQEASTYEQRVVLSPSCEEEDYDSDYDGALMNQSALIITALDLMRGVLHAPTKTTRHVLVTQLSAFVYTMIGYMQISVSQMKAWLDNPNQYVADEDDASLALNVRNVATDLLSELETVLGRKAVIAALNAAQRRLKTDDLMHWRLQEAALLVVGSLASSTLKIMETNATDMNRVLDISAFLQTLFQVMNAESQEIYLRARALWCASRFVTVMHPEMLDAFFKIAISGLAQEQMVPVRLYACRAIGAILRTNTGQTRVMEASQVVLDRLVTLAEHSTHETLHIALETIVIVLQEATNLPFEPTQRVLTCFLHHWRSQLNDPLISELIDSALGALLQLEETAISTHVHHQVVPVISTMLVQSFDESRQAGSSCTAASALTIFKTLLRHSFVSRNKEPRCDTTHELGVQIVQQTFEPLVMILHAMDDEKVLTAGSECLKWMVLVAVESLAAYTTASGQNGIDTLLLVSAQLLSPTASDASAICVGGLITQILLKLGPRLPPSTVQSILSAVCARLATTDSPALVQSLCMVFARLVHSYGSDFLNVLEQLPSNDWECSSMLPFVFRTWMEKQPDFYGLYCIKVTITALLKAVEWHDRRLEAILVPRRTMDTLSGSCTGIQTRSKSRGTRASDHTPTVHFLTAFVVCLAKTLAQLADEEDEWVSSDDESSDSESCDEAVGTVTSSVFAPAENYQLLSDCLETEEGVEMQDGGEPEEEFEAYFDPINDVDLKIVIRQALQGMSENSIVLQAIMPELTVADKEALAAVSALSS